MTDDLVPFTSGDDPTKLHDAWKYLVPIAYKSKRIDLRCDGPILRAITNAVLDIQLKRGTTPSILILDVPTRKLLEREIFGLELEGSDRLHKIRGLEIIDWPTDRFEIA